MLCILVFIYGCVVYDYIYHTYNNNDIYYLFIVITLLSSDTGIY